MNEKDVKKLEAAIEVLDPVEDGFFIDVLRQRISKYNKIKRSDISITKQEFKSAKTGIRRTLSVYVTSLNKRAIKSGEIARRVSNCDECPLSKELTHLWCGREIPYKGMDESNPVCINCNRKSDILEGIEIENEKLSKQITEKVIKENKELVKLKAIVNKLNRKLYETCKH